jgi:hypothetical protein
LRTARFFTKSNPIHPDNRKGAHMRAEAQAIAENIKQSLELLRRHL